MIIKDKNLDLLCFHVFLKEKWKQGRGFILFILISFILSCCSFFVWASYPILFNQTSIDLVIQPHSSFRQIAKQMVQVGIPINAYFFECLGRFLGKSKFIKAGVYIINEGSSPYEILKKITRGDVHYSSITIIEGWTFLEMRSAIDAHPDLLHDTCNLTNRALLRLIGINHSSPEGLFFPDTYLFPKKSSDVVVYEIAYRTMKNKLKLLWDGRDAELPLKKQYDTLILASLIEKETSRREDRQKISGVFINRLKKNMPLQTDPAVIYGIKRDLSSGKKFVLNKNALKAYTPYNTYMNMGLPPTPIALPGWESIKAALHPMKTSAYYFVAIGNGDTYFSNTLHEHNKAVRIFIKKKK